MNIQVITPPIAYHWRLLCAYVPMAVGMLSVPVSAWMFAADRIAEPDNVLGLLVGLSAGGFAVVSRSKLGFWAGVRQVDFAPDGLTVYTDQAKSFIDRENVKRVVIGQYDGHPVSLTVVVRRESPMRMECVKIPDDANDRLMNLPAGYWTIKKRKRLFNPFSHKHMVGETVLWACYGLAAGLLFSWVFF